MVLTEKQIFDSVEARKFAPVYLLTGEENYFIDLLSSLFEEKTVPQEVRDFAQTVVYGRDITVAEVVALAKQSPMMSPLQLVMVKEAQDISGREGAWEPLTKYLDSPTSTTVLVLCYRNKKFDKRTKVYKAINAKGVVFERGKLRDNELPDWIANYVAKRGYSITQKGAVLLAEFIGNDLSKVVNELSKVFIDLPLGSVIDDSVIEQNVGISKEYNDFELQAAIGRRDAYMCNRIVNHFAANPKNNPLQRTLANLYSYVIKIMIYHQEPDKSKAASAMGVHPYFLKDYAVAASNYKLGKLASCIGYIYEADLRSKGVHNTGTVTDGEILKELVFKMIH